MKIKNKIIFVLLSIFVFSTLLGFSNCLYFNNDIKTVSAASYSGSGTSSNPYKITSSAEYNQMAEDVSSYSASGDYYSIEFDVDGALINQIESNYANLNFNFNTITAPQKSIIKYNYGTVENLLITNANIRDVDVKTYKTVPSFYTTGSIADINEGSIYYCGVTNSSINIFYLNGFVTIGGIAGTNSGTIEQCYVYNTGLMIGVSRSNEDEYYAAGGIAGYLIGGSIDTCISIGNNFYEDDNGVGIGLRVAQSNNYIYLSRLKGGIFGLSNPSHTAMSISGAGVATNSDYLIYDSDSSVKNCYSDYKDYSWANATFDIEYDYSVIPSAKETSYSVNVRSYTEVYDLCIGGYAYGSYVSANTYSNNYSKYDLSDKNTIWLDINQLNTSQYNTVAQALAPTDVLGLYPENGWVIPSSTTDNYGYPYLEYNVPTATLNCTYINTDSEYPETGSTVIELTNDGSGWKSNYTLSSYFSNSSTTLPSDNNGTYKLLGYFLKSSINSTYCATYRYNSSNYANIYVTSTDTGALTSYGTVYIYYSDSGTYSLEIFEGDVVDGGTYTLCPIYLFEQESYTVYFQYNTISKLNSGTPNVTLYQDDGSEITEVVYGYGASGNLSFTVTEPSFSFSMADDDNDYYILWYVYKSTNANLSSNIIATSLDGETSIDSSNFSNVLYGEMSNTISWDLVSGQTTYVVKFQAFPKIPITLNANGGTGSKTVYALPGHDFIFDDKGSTDSSISHGISRSGYSLSGFSKTSTGTTLILDGDLEIQGDGTYFNSSSQLISTNGSYIYQTGMTLYAVWEQTVDNICTINVVYSGASLTGTTYKFYYNADTVPSGAIGQGNQESISIPSGYTLNGTVSYSIGYNYNGYTVSTFLDEAANDYFITSESYSLSNITGNYTITITVPVKEEEEPCLYVTVKYVDENENSIASDANYEVEYLRLADNTETWVEYGYVKTITGYTATVSRTVKKGSSTILSSGDGYLFVTDSYLSVAYDSFSGNVGDLYYTVKVYYEESAEKNICYITVVYSGTSQSDEVYKFYIDGTVSTDLSQNILGRGEEVSYNIPSGYKQDGSVTATGQYIATLLSNYSGSSFTTQSSISNIFIDGSIYNITLTVPCVAEEEPEPPTDQNVCIITIKYTCDGSRISGQSDVVYYFYYKISQNGTLPGVYENEITQITSVNNFKINIGGYTFSKTEYSGNIEWLYTTNDTYFVTHYAGGTTNPTSITVDVQYTIDEQPEEPDNSSDKCTITVNYLISGTSTSIKAGESYTFYYRNSSLGGIGYNSTQYYSLDIDGYTFFFTSYNYDFGHESLLSSPAQSYFITATSSSSVDSSLSGNQLITINVYFSVDSSSDDSDVCIITIKYTCGGNSISNDVTFEFYYNEATGTDPSGGDLVTLEKIEYSDLSSFPSTSEYTHDSTNYVIEPPSTLEVSNFLWYAEKEYFKTENVFGGATGTHYLTITLEFSEVEPGEEESSDYLIIQVQHLDENEKSIKPTEFYYFNYLNVYGNISGMELYTKLGYSETITFTTEIEGYTYDSTTYAYLSFLTDPELLITHNDYSFTTKSQWEVSGCSGMSSAVFTLKFKQEVTEDNNHATIIISYEDENGDTVIDTEYYYFNYLAGTTSISKWEDAGYTKLYYDESVTFTTDVSGYEYDRTYCSDINSAKDALLTSDNFDYGFTTRPYSDVMNVTGYKSLWFTIYFTKNQETPSEVSVCNFNIVFSGANTTKRYKMPLDGSGDSDSDSSTIGFSDYVYFSNIMPTGYEISGTVEYEDTYTGGYGVSYFIFMSSNSYFSTTVGVWNELVYNGENYIITITVPCKLTPTGDYCKILLQYKDVGTGTIISGESITYKFYYDGTTSTDIDNYILGLNARVSIYNPTGYEIYGDISDIDVKLGSSIDTDQAYLSYFTLNEDYNYYFKTASTAQSNNVGDFTIIVPCESTKYCEIILQYKDVDTSVILSDYTETYKFYYDGSQNDPDNNILGYYTKVNFVIPTNYVQYGNYRNIEVKFGDSIDTTIYKKYYFTIQSTSFWTHTESEVEEYGSKDDPAPNYPFTITVPCQSNLTDNYVEIILQYFDQTGYTVEDKIPWEYYYFIYKSADANKVPTGLDTSNYTKLGFGATIDFKTIDGYVIYETNYIDMIYKCLDVMLSKQETNYCTTVSRDADYTSNATILIQIFLKPDYSGDYVNITVGNNIDTNVDSYVFYYNDPTLNSDSLLYGAVTDITLQKEGYVFTSLKISDNYSDFIFIEDDSSAFVTKEQTEYIVGGVPIYSGVHSITITVQFVVKPDDVCIVTYKFNGTNEDDIVFEFYYLDADNTGNIGYNKYFNINPPDGYFVRSFNITDNDNVKATFFKYLLSNMIWTVESAPTNITGTYYITVDLECVESITLDLTFYYVYTYEHNGTTYDYNMGTITRTWEVTGADNYDIPNIDTKYPVINASINSSTSSDVKSCLSIDLANMRVNISGVTNLTPGATYDVYIDCTGVLTVVENIETRKNAGGYYNVVYYQGYVNEGTIDTAPLSSISGANGNVVNENKNLSWQRLSVMTYFIIVGTADYVITPEGNLEIEDSFVVTGYNISDSALNVIKTIYDTNTSSGASHSTSKPNGYKYDSEAWCYDINKTKVVFGQDVNDVTFATMLYNSEKINIYQNWQYATYEVSINKNIYSPDYATFEYTTGESLDYSVIAPTDLDGFAVKGWYIVDASVSNGDSDYNIYTSKGYLTSADENWKNSPRDYVIVNYIYNTNLMYGNFVIEPIFDSEAIGPQDLIFEFGITIDQYYSGNSNGMVYSDMTFDTTNVSYILEDVDINSTVDLAEKLTEAYKVIPKFYQDTTTKTKYYLVGWTCSQYAGEYKESNLSHIFLFDTGVIPATIITDSPVYNAENKPTGGKIYAVWAKLYEIRVALYEDVITGQETSLYNGSNLVQRGNDLKIEEVWQDEGENYYLFFYGETLAKNSEVVLYFDINTAIGQTPNTAGYSLSYKYNAGINNIEDVSLKTLSGYRVFGQVSTTTYYVNNNVSLTTTSTVYSKYNIEDNTQKVEFNTLIKRLINRAGMGTVLTIEPVWEEVKFNVIVNGDENSKVTAIKDYTNTFTVNATGAFDIWPEDASNDISKYEGWYFDYLTDVVSGSNKFTQIINGKTTYLPIGTDFYNKILRVSGGSVSKIYNINVVNTSNVLNLTLEFNTHYIGAVYALTISHIDANGKVITNSNLNILESENIIDWIYNASSGKLNVEDILVPGWNTKGANIINYSETSVISLLKKYSYSGTYSNKTAGVDNSEAFANYPNKLFKTNDGSYFITLQDKTGFKEEDFINNVNIRSSNYALDFYEYATEMTSCNDTSIDHICYDIGAMSIELNGASKQFTEESKYTNAFVVNYNNGNCDWSFDSVGLAYSSTRKIIYARWLEKTYNLNFAVNFEEKDSDAGYLVVEVTKGTTTKYYAYVYRINETTGEAGYVLYSIPDATTFNDKNFYGNWNDDGNVTEVGTVLEVPAGSTVTVSAYDQSEDINYDPMLGYRFDSVDIINPYNPTEYTCNVGENTYITYGGCINKDGDKSCSYTSTTTGVVSNYYIYSTGDKTIFKFTSNNLNTAFDLHEDIYLTANLEKILYNLSANINSTYGSLSYEYNQNTEFGLYDFTLNDIVVGNNLAIKYSSPLGYEINGWQFTSSKGALSNIATNSTTWSDGRTSGSYQTIDAYFLRKFAYKDLTSFPTNAKQTLGVVTPVTGLIKFNLSVTILDNISKSRFEQFAIESDNQFINLNNGTTVSLGGNYELIVNATNRTSYACYVNNSKDYAVLRMYIADKNSGVAEYIDYAFPITSLDSLEFVLTTQLLDKLVQYTQGIPVLQENRNINVVVLVSKIITINSEENAVLQETTDIYDPKNGVRELSANDVIIASANNNQYVTKKNTQYAYVGQKVNMVINALDSKYYSGAQITVNQSGITSDYTLKSAGSQEVSLTEETTVNIKFIPATLDIAVNFIYKGVTYEASRYNELMNMSNVQILTKTVSYTISDENGNNRSVKFFYGDTLSLNFDKTNFNSKFIVNNILTEYEYWVFINGVKVYANNGIYTSVLTKATVVNIEIIDLTGKTAQVKTNMNNCGTIYGVSKSNIIKLIGNNTEEFSLYSGDSLTIYIKHATGYNFVDYSYNDEHKVVALVEETEGDYAGYYKFTLIAEYSSVLSGLYSLNFELLTMNVELVYVVDGEVNNNAGTGYQLSSDTSDILGDVTISNVSANNLASTGFRFIGYTVGETFEDGEEIIENGSYQVTIKLADYVEFISNNVLTIYINFIRQYQINVSVDISDYEQTKISLYQDINPIFENYSNTKLPWTSAYLDSSDYSNYEYKIAVDNRSGLNTYYATLTLNGELIEETHLEVTKPSVNNNATNLTYTFRLDSIEFTKYEFKVTYMPERLSTTLKEYYIDTIDQVNDYLSSSTLPTGSEYVVTDDDVVLNNNLATNKTNINLYISNSNASLANRYNVQHSVTISLNQDYGYSIYQIWIGDEKVVDANEKRYRSNHVWTITDNTEIKIIYKKICLVSE